MRNRRSRRDANGVTGYLTETDHPVVRSTARTRDLVVERNTPADAARAAAVQSRRRLINAKRIRRPRSTSAGGTVRVVPRLGHTESDISLELDDPSIVFTGDLLWNAMFPNFVDAMPMKLNASVHALRRTRPRPVYVPGHGAIAPRHPTSIGMSRC